MDAKFRPAMEAIEAHDLERFRQLIIEDPSLASSRSLTSHPTLLQYLVLSARDSPNQLEMAKILIDHGAELNAPLVACGSCNNVAAAELLLNSGAAIYGTGGWSPLEEALYWDRLGVVDLLVRRGAPVQNLRIAAGLGRIDAIEGFFESDGRLKPQAGTINWRWGDATVIANSNFDAAGKQYLTKKFSSWTNDRQSLINNAFVYAGMHGHLDAVRLLLERGAQINAIPGGFDFSGTALHYAALNGQQSMVEFLLQRGANVHIKDEKVGSLASGWADYGGHAATRDYLRGLEKQ